MNSAGFSHFRRQPVFALILLSVTTLTLYLPFWFLRQTRALEVTPGARRLSLPLIYASLVLAVSSIAWALPEVLSDDSLWALATGKLLGWADLIVCLAVLFQLRRRLNEVQNAHRGEPSWFSLVFTWALGPLYLQYKLNRLIPSNPALLEAGRAQP